MKPTVQKATLSRPRTPQSSHCCIFLSPTKIVHSDMQARQPPQHKIIKKGHRRRGTRQA